MIKMNKQLQQQNFHEVEVTSGFIMKLIKQTQENIRLGKKTINEKGNNAHRQTHNKSDWYKIRS